MTEKKRPVGRPTIYDGSHMGQRYGQRQRRMEPQNGSAVQQEEKTAQQSVQNVQQMERIAQEAEQRPVMRRRDQDNEQKMRKLRVLLCVLIMLLIAAIFHQVILGHGIQMTGQERMAFREESDD